MTRAADAYALVGNQELVLRREGAENLLQIRGVDGQVTLSIRVTPAGPVLCFEGADVVIEAQGKLAIRAQCLALQGREGLALTSGGDAWIDVAGDLSSHARVQNISADLGNVNVRANDDVTLKGERVRINHVET